MVRTRWPSTVAPKRGAGSGRPRRSGAGSASSEPLASWAYGPVSGGGAPGSVSSATRQGTTRLRIQRTARRS